MSLRPVHSLNRPLRPKDRLVFAQQDDAVRHALQDPLVLHKSGDVDDFGEMVGVGIDADILAAAQMRKGPHRRDVDDFDLVAKPLAKSNLRIVLAAQTKHLGTLTRPLGAGGMILLRSAWLVHDPDIQGQLEVRSTAPVTAETWQTAPSPGYLARNSLKL